MILLYFLKVTSLHRRLSSTIYEKRASLLSIYDSFELYGGNDYICVGSLVFELNSISIILWRLCVHNKVHHAWLSSYWKLKCVHRAVKRAQLCCIYSDELFVQIHCFILWFVGYTMWMECLLGCEKILQIFLTCVV